MACTGSMALLMLALMRHMFKSASKMHGQHGWDDMVWYGMARTGNMALLMLALMIHTFKSASRTHGQHGIISACINGKDGHLGAVTFTGIKLRADSNALYLLCKGTILGLWLMLNHSSLVASMFA